MTISYDLSFGAVHVWQRNRDTFLRMWRTESWPPVVEPLLNLLAIGFGIGAYVSGITGSESYLHFVAPGFVASSLLFSASFECLFGSFIRMDYQRTYDAIVATPVSIDDVAVGEMLWGATRGLIAASGVIVISSLLGLMAWPWAILLFPLAFLAGFTFAAIALVVTSVVPSINSFNYYFTLAITPMFLFSENLFPVDRLPDFARSLTLLSPLTHFVRPARAIAAGHFSPELLLNILVLIVLGIVAAGIAIQLLKRRLIR